MRLSSPADAYERAAEANAARVMRAPLNQPREAVAAPGRHAPSQGPPTVQRKLGFEAELSVPTVMPPRPGGELTSPLTGAVAPPSAESFLRGGIKHGTLIGKDLNFTLKPDHNNKLQERQLDIRAKLETLDYNIPPQPSEHNTSNLEYIPPPLDELAPHSTAKFRAQFNAISHHALKFFRYSKSELITIPPPAVGGYQAGIPFSQLKAWLGSDYHKVEPEIKDFVAEIKPTFYPQATAGIILSALPALHRSLVLPPGIDAIGIHAIAAEVKQLVDKLRVKKFFARSQFINDLKTHEIDYQAFVGVLYLISSYLIGSAVNQTDLFTGATPKSSVAFMSKLRVFSRVIKSAAPQHLRTMRIPVDLVEDIADYFNNSPATAVETWIGNGVQLDPDRKPTIKDIKTFVTEMLTGSGTATTDAATSEIRTFTRPDPLPRRVAASSGRQKGLQMEYRHIAARPGLQTLPTALMEIVREVRELNTQHLKPELKQRILNAADS